MYKTRNCETYYSIFVVISTVSATGSHNLVEETEICDQWNLVETFASELIQY